jgi:hypothetical protein
MTHRPELHVTPGIGILDAPAGSLFDGASWHIFHQFRPRDTEGARWAHQCASTTPFFFEECDDVLAPDQGEAEVRAGAVTNHGEDALLYFTSVRDNSRSIHLAQLTDVAASTITVNDEASQLDPAVHRIGEIIGDFGPYTRLRSPCVIPDWRDTDDRDSGHSGWIMIALAGASQAPDILVFHSDDGKHWDFTGELTISGATGLGGTAIVAPRLVRLRDEVDNQLKDVLIVTLEHDGIDVSGYLVGVFNDTTFTVSHPFRRIDYGHDFTRPRNTNMALAQSDIATRYNQAYLYGLMNGVGRLDDGHEHLSYRAEGWANCLSLPRRVTLENGILYQTPAPGLVDAIQQSDYAMMYSGIFEVPTSDWLMVELIDSIGQVAATISHFGDRLELDRSMNLHHEGDPVAVAELGEGDTDAITIIADGSTVEVFADGGQVAMASRVYFTGKCEEFVVACTRNVQIEHTTTVTPLHWARQTRLDDIEEGIIR